MRSEHVPKDLYLEGEQRLSSEFLFSSPHSAWQGGGSGSLKQCMVSGR